MTDNQITSAVIIQKWYREVKDRQWHIMKKVRFDNIKKLGEAWKKKKNDKYKKYNVKQTGDVSLDEFNLSKARSPDLEWSRGSPRTFVRITTYNHCACGSNKEDKKCCGPKKR